MTGSIDYYMQQWDANPAITANQDNAGVKAARSEFASLLKVVSSQQTQIEELKANANSK